MLIFALIPEYSSNQSQGAREYAVDVARNVNTHSTMIQMKAIVYMKDGWSPGSAYKFQMTSILEIE